MSMISNPFLSKGSRFAVVGLGVSGRAAVRYAQQFASVEILVSDMRVEEDLVGELEQLGLENAFFEAGQHSYDFLRQADTVFVSPGVAEPELFSRLEAIGVEVVGELSLLAPVITSPVIAITGTNGKTTVTTLIGELLRAAGHKVFVGGNIGTPLLQWLVEGEEADYLVLELSSFQLERIGNFPIEIALLLNITPDHLDRHGSLAGYRRAKMAIFAGQKRGGYALFNDDEPQTKPSLDCGFANRVGFGHSAKEIVVKDQEVYLSSFAESYDLRETVFANRVGGMNAAPALWIARTIGVSKQQSDEVLAQFSLGAHRLEEVAELAGVRYVNDSKATNTGAVISALQQFPRVHLIAGGRDKGDDYSLLRNALRKHGVQLFLIGEASKLIAAAVGDLIPTFFCKDLNEAVSRASLTACRGDVVLLAPACASFDMFANYGDRGEKFCQAVAKLGEKREDGE